MEALRDDCMTYVFGSTSVYNTSPVLSMCVMVMEPKSREAGKQEVAKKMYEQNTSKIKSTNKVPRTPKTLGNNRTHHCDEQKQCDTNRN